MNLTLSAGPAARTASSSKAAWPGRVLTTLAVLFLLIDGAGKVLRIAPVMEACAPLEIPARVIPGLGAVLIAATLAYAFPPTAPLGAIVLTGYLGGATWTHVRLGGPAFPMIFPSLVAALAWGGLLLRESRLRALMPLRKPIPPGIPYAG